MEFIGREINLALAPEAVRGTATATAERTVRKVTCNLIPRAERVVDDTTFGRLEDAERVRTVRRWSEGDVSGIVHADVIGYYLLNLYGAPESTPVAGSITDHVFELEQSIQHPTLTFFVKDGEVRQEKIAGGVVSQFELTAATDNYVRYNATFLGKEGEDDASELPELENEYDFVSRDITVQIAENEGALADAPAIKLKNLSINWNPNAEADWVFGSYSPDNIYNKQFVIEGEFEKNFTDETFKDLYEGDDFRYMKITIEGEAELGGGGQKPTITVLLYKVQITDWNRSSEGDALAVETVSFKAFYNTEDGKQSQVTVRNLTESYATGS
jgi:hypothetical protein